MSILRMSEAEVQAHQRRVAAYRRKVDTAELDAPAIAAENRRMSRQLYELTPVMEGDGFHRFKIRLPLRLRSLANERTNPFLRARRAKGQRNAIRNSIGAGLLPKLPVTVTITRQSFRPMDSDNLAISAKHVRDAIAELYGVDDASPLYTWNVRQEKGPPKVFSCLIEIERRPA